MHSKDLACVVLRVSLGLVFLYFSISQLNSPSEWSSFVPGFLTNFGLSANNFVVFNGFIELVFGIFLIIGLYTRFSALVMSLHLFGIAFSIGFNPLGIRDFGLAFSTLALFLFGPDKYTLDYKYSKNTNR